MPEDMEDKIVFCLMPPKEKDKPVTVMIGIPDKCFSEMRRTGKTQVLSFDKLGLPVQFVLFGCDNYEAGMQEIMDASQLLGIKVEDQRGRNFKPPEPPPVNKNKLN